MGIIATRNSILDDYTANYESNSLARENLRGYIDDVAQILSGNYRADGKRAWKWTEREKYLNEKLEGLDDYLTQLAPEEINEEVREDLAVVNELLTNEVNSNNYLKRNKKNVHTRLRSMADRTRSNLKEYLLPANSLELIEPGELESSVEGSVGEPEATYTGISIDDAVGKTRTQASHTQANYDKGKDESSLLKRINRYAREGWGQAAAGLVAAGLLISSSLLPLSQVCAENENKSENIRVEQIQQEQTQDEQGRIDGINKNSIVDYLKSKNLSSDFESRKELYKAVLQQETKNEDPMVRENLGEKYEGTALQNLWLLTVLEGKECWEKENNDCLMDYLGSFGSEKEVLEAKERGQELAQRVKAGAEIELEGENLGRYLESFEPEQEITTPILSKEVKEDQPEKISLSTQQEEKQIRKKQKEDIFAALDDYSPSYSEEDLERIVQGKKPNSKTAVQFFKNLFGSSAEERFMETFCEMYKTAEGQGELEEAEPWLREYLRQGADIWARNFAPESEREKVRQGYLEGVVNNPLPTYFEKWNEGGESRVVEESGGEGSNPIKALKKGAGKAGKIISLPGRAVRKAGGKPAEVILDGLNLPGDIIKAGEYMKEGRLPTALAQILFRGGTTKEAYDAAREAVKEDLGEILKSVEDERLPIYEKEISGAPAGTKYQLVMFEPGHQINIYGKGMSRDLANPSVGDAQIEIIPKQEAAKEGRTRAVLEKVHPSRLTDRREIEEARKNGFFGVRNGFREKKIVEKDYLEPESITKEAFETMLADYKEIPMMLVDDKDNLVAVAFKNGQGRFTTNLDNATFDLEEFKTRQTEAWKSIVRLGTNYIIFIGATAEQSIGGGGVSGGRGELEENKF